MDVPQQNRLRLEPIQEESEREDETEKNKTGEGNEDDFPFQVGLEEEDAQAEDVSDRDDDAQLRVLRPRKRSRSTSHSANNQREETESLSVFDLSTSELRGDATAPGQPTFTNVRRSRSGKLKVKVSKIKWQKQTRPKQQVRKPRISSERDSVVHEPFPQWLVDLMVSIEEATTHQLVVE